MNWQDILITISGVGFIVALIPSLLSEKKPEKSTCLSTSVFLFLILIAYLSLGLWWSSITTFITLGIWFWMYWQQREKSKKSKKK